MSEYGVSGRAELIAELQEVQRRGDSMPLEYAARELERVPLDRIIAGIEGAQATPVDTDVFTMLPEAMHGVACSLQGQLAALLEQASHEAAYVAGLNLDAIADHTFNMQTIGANAGAALMAMRAALEAARQEAQRAKELLAAARAEAEAAVTAKTHFTQALGGYLEIV